MREDASDMPPFRADPFAKVYSLAEHMGGAALRGYRETHNPPWSQEDVALLMRRYGFDWTNLSIEH